MKLLSTVLLLLLALASRGVSEADVPWATDAVAQLNALLASPNRECADWADRLVSERLAVDEFAAATFGDYPEKSLDAYRSLLPSPRFTHLVEHYRSRLSRAYQHRLRADLAAQLASPALRGLRLDSLEVNGPRARAQLRAVFDARSLGVEVELIFANQTWKIAALKIDGQSVASHYRRRYQPLIDRGHSPPVLEAQLAEREFVVLEDFAATWDESQPLEWGPWKKKDRHKSVLYRVEGRPRRYMAARDSSHSVIVGKFAHWNPRQYPIMTWCWRAAALPLGGNEFLDDANDSAAGVYVIFSKNWLGVPKQLKYVWSTTLPEGTVGRRDKIFRPWFFVVESGATNLGKWTFEVVDLEKHHREKLGGRPAGRTIGLGLLTDANSTRSYAEAHYADLRVWTRQAFDGGRVVNYCGGLPGLNGAYPAENSQ